MDIEKLLRVFIDEAVERIGEIEDGLLEIEKSPQDMELINSIFRAAHTIKGSSGTFGLSDISRFTHCMEEILDLMRNGKLIPEKEIVNTLLEANDILKEMIETVASGGSFDFSRCEGLVSRMKSLAEKKELRQFKIIFIPSADLFRRGIEPTIIIEDLKNIGEIVDIQAYSDEVPTLSEFNPEELYLRWDILLRTDREESEIKEVFEFVEDGSKIKIFPVTDAEKDIPFLGQMLIKEGVVAPEDVDAALKTQKRLGEILVEEGKATSEEIERVIAKQRNSKQESFKKSITSTIRVDLGKLDHLVNIVGEMVIIHSMFQQFINSNGNREAEKLDLIFNQLQRIGKDIQESVMSLRMLPVGEVFHRFTRLVRELSETRNKEIELIITGEETELDKGVLEKITDPLVHLIRNAIDHGIEETEERIAKGKPARGRIHLSAFQLGDSVYIEVEDDGRGLDREKILRKALSAGLINSGEGLTDDQIFNLIFQPGFSTAEKVTDISGRGVGMDVVKKNIESLNGKIFIRTKPDAGTTISIKLPLTLAIIDGLTVGIGEEVFVIPISSVIESLRPERCNVKTLNEKGEVINVRDEYIPLLRLHEILDIPAMKIKPWEAIVVVTSHEDKKYGLLVDDLIGQQQVVIKNLGNAMPKVRDIAGGTILGDGRVALVLDVPGIIDIATKALMN